MQYEQVLTIRDKNNKLIGFWCHDLKEHNVTLYLCQKATLDEIKDLDFSNPEVKIPMRIIDGAGGAGGYDNGQGGGGPGRK